MSKFFKHKSSYIDPKAIVGEGTKIWHFCNVLGNVSIGKNCILGQNVFIGENVILGNNVKVQNNVSIYDGVHCKNDVFIGPSVVFTNVINPRSFVERKNEFKKTTLFEGSTVGANATVICGNSIGRYSLIGAGSIVNRDVKDFEVVVGNPIRHIGWVDINGSRLNFQSKKQILSNGKKYVLENNNIKIE